MIAPIPYMGQYGPLRKPVFIIFFSQMDLYTDSIIHPRNEYIIKYVVNSITFKFIFSPYYLVSFALNVSVTSFSL